jgi:hypothetical protein
MDDQPGDVKKLEYIILGKCENVTPVSIMNIIYSLIGLILYQRDLSEY